MNSKKIACTLIAFSLFSAVSCDKNSKSDEQKTPAINLADLDTTVRPQDDFYHYVNGGWIKNNPLKPAYSRYGTFDVLRDSSLERLHGIVNTLATSKAKKGTNEYRVATLYNQSMDSLKRNELGATPIQKELKAIEAIADKKQVVTYIAQNHNEGSGMLFGTYVGADNMNSDMNIMHVLQTSLPLGNRDYYIKSTPEFTKILEAYNLYVEKLATLSGYTQEEAQRIAKNNIAISTQLAQMCYSQEELRDDLRNYHKLSTVSFAEANKSFDWKEYLRARKLDKVESWNVAQLDFFKKFDVWFKNVDLNQLKDFFLASTMDDAASYLSDSFVEAGFDFYGRTLSGRKEMHPRWRRSVDVVNSMLGEALGEIYVKQYFPPQAKERMITLIANLQSALKERIQGLGWMSAETKEKAVAKLSSFRVKVGYPDTWKDYSKLDIDAAASYYENVRRSVLFEHQRNMDKLGKPVDREEWLMNPQDVNAYYMPTTNEICFPAGILQPPFFNLDADDAVNYGAIGVVIGHEMTHGFDDQGRNFDKDGNMNDWWTAADSEMFTKSAQRLVEQFNAIQITPTLKANGAYTLGENIADQGGLVVAYAALQKALKGKTVEPIDGFTPAQRFFIGYARLWGQNITEQEKVRLTQIDVHSLGENRVNQTLKNLDIFYDAFNIQPTDKMYIAPEQRVIVW